jgi:hypothetical protein
MQTTSLGNDFMIKSCLGCTPIRNYRILNRVDARPNFATLSNRHLRKLAGYGLEISAVADMRPFSRLVAQSRPCRAPQMSVGNSISDRVELNRWKLGPCIACGYSTWSLVTDRLFISMPLSQFENSSAEAHAADPDFHETDGVTDSKLINVKT